MPDCPEAKRILDGTVSVWEILSYIQADCWLSKKSAAQYSAHGEARLEEAIRAGELHAYNCGKKIVIRKSDIDAWILAHEAKPRDSKIDKTDLQSLMDRAMKFAKRGAA